MICFAGGVFFAVRVDVVGVDVFASCVPFVFLCLGDFGIVVSFEFFGGVVVHGDGVDAFVVGVVACDSSDVGDGEVEVFVFGADAVVGLLSGDGVADVFFVEGGVV